MSNIWTNRRTRRETTATPEGEIVSGNILRNRADKMAEIEANIRASKNQPSRIERRRRWTETRNTYSDEEE